jgi:hypothetical protein
MANKIMDGRSFNRPDGKRWYIEAKHHTGVWLDPSLCAWYHTRQQARDAVAERTRRGEA